MFRKSSNLDSTTDVKGPPHAVGACTGRRMLRMLVICLAAFAALLGMSAVAQAGEPVTVHSAGVTLRGFGATVNFSTNIAADATVWVTEKPMVGPATNPQPAGGFQTIVQGGHGTSFTVNVAGLTPGRTYYATTMTYDPVGYSFGWDTNRPFKTLTQYVDITTTTLHVKNDSDADGCGELYTSLSAYDSAPSHGGPFWLFDANAENTVCDGHDLSMANVHNYWGGGNDSGLIAWPSSTVELGGGVIDDDTVFGCHPLNQPDECGESAHAAMTLNLVHDQSVTQKFSLRMRSTLPGEDLDATLYGTVRVLYLS